jgi:hypothetical protein
MHRILLKADFWKEYNDYCRCDVLISNYIKQKEEVYYSLQDYMTNSGKVEFLKKPAVKRVIGGVVSTFNRPSKNKWVWFHFWLN